MPVNTDRTKTSCKYGPVDKLKFLAVINRMEIRSSTKVVIGVMLEYVNNSTGRITVTHETLIRESLLGKTAVRLALKEAEHQDIFKVVRRGKQSATKKYANIYIPSWNEVEKEYVKWQKRKEEIKKFKDEHPDFDENEPDCGSDESKKCGDSLMEKPLSGSNGTLFGSDESKKCGDSLLSIPVYYIPSIERERAALLDSKDSTHEPINGTSGTINTGSHQNEIAANSHHKESISANSHQKGSSPANSHQKGNYPVVGLTIPRGELSFIEEEHEANIRKWLVSLGLPFKKVKRMGFSLMMKYYNDDTDSFIQSFKLPATVSVAPAAVPAAGRAAPAAVSSAIAGLLAELAKYGPIFHEQLSYIVSGL